MLRFHSPGTSSFCSLVARGRTFASGSRALCLRSTERPRDAAGRVRRRRSRLGRDFLPPGRDNRTPPQPAPSSWQPAELARSDGLPAEQRQLQVRARLRLPAAPGAQRGPGASHHLLRLLGVPGGATSAGSDPLWPRVSVRELGWRDHPAGKDAGEAESTKWVGVEQRLLGNPMQGWLGDAYTGLRAGARGAVWQGVPTMHSSPADSD